MAAVRRRWLGKSHSANGTGSNLFGGELNVKFRNLLQHALDPNELILSQFYSGPGERLSKFLVFRRIESRPGSLIALTSGNRLLRVTDHYKDRCERYAGIIISAPTLLFETSEVERGTDHYELVISFSSGISWRVSMHTNESECHEFSRALNSRLTGKLHEISSDLDLMRPHAAGNKKP